MNNILNSKMVLFLRSQDSRVTFQEWTPDVDTSRSPVVILINSTELCAAGFNLKEVLSPALVAPARVHTRGPAQWSLEGMGPKRFVLSVDDATEFRSRCEWIIPFFSLKFSIFPMNFLTKKKHEGSSDTLTMIRMKTLFRPLLDHHDRGISLV